MMSFLNLNMLASKAVQNERGDEKFSKPLQFGEALNALLKQADRQPTETTKTDEAIVEGAFIDTDIEQSTVAEPSLNLMPRSHFTWIVPPLPLSHTTLKNEPIAGFSSRTHTLFHPNFLQQKPLETTFPSHKKLEGNETSDAFNGDKKKVFASKPQAHLPFDDHMKTQNNNARNVSFEKRDDGVIAEVPLPKLTSAQTPPSVVNPIMSADLQSHVTKFADANDMSLSNITIANVKHEPPSKQGGLVATITLELMPKELGKIALSLSRTGDEMIVRIRAERDDTAQQFARDQSLIQTVLRDAMVLTDNVPVRVIVSDQPNNLLQHNMPQASQSHDQPSFADQQMQQEQAREQFRHQNHDHSAREPMRSTDTTDNENDTQAVAKRRAIIL